jgi:hypothetical protein
MNLNFYKSPLFLLISLLLSTKTFFAFAEPPGPPRGIFRNNGCTKWLEKNENVLNRLFLADALHVPPGELRNEFLNRQKRLRYLEVELTIRVKSEGAVSATTDKFLREKKNSLLDPLVLWKQTIAEMETEYGKNYKLPSFVNRNAAPGLKKILCLKSLTRGMRLLAEYRLEISQALTTLPLDTEITKADEYEMARRIDYIVEAYRKKIIASFLNEVVEEVVMEVVGEGPLTFVSLLLESTPLPRLISLELEKQLDFDRKYSLPSNWLFMEFSMIVDSCYGKE